MNTATVELPVIPAQSPRFVDNGDGTVTDTSNGLMWSKETLTPECVNHAQAEKVCADCTAGGHTDWRLPTIEELFALADRSRHGPAIDTEAFPDTQSDWYWSSTPLAWSSDYAWIVDFSYGDANYDHRGCDDALARAVRSVPAGQ
jgi:hypothetical protein